MKKNDKITLVGNLAKELKSATSVVLVDYNKLTVKQQQALKLRLEEAGAYMQVVKNTLFKRAANEVKLSDGITTDTVLTGPTAMVIGSEDPIAPLQALYKFSKEFEVPNLKVGIVDGVFQGKDELEKLAKLPSKNVLFAQVVGALGAPMTVIAYTLQANIQKLLYVLSAKAKN